MKDLHGLFEGWIEKCGEFLIRGGDDCQHLKSWQDP